MADGGSVEPVKGVALVLVVPPKGCSLPAVRVANPSAVLKELSLPRVSFEYSRGVTLESFASHAAYYSRNAGVEASYALDFTERTGTNHCKLWC